MGDSGRKLTASEMIRMAQKQSKARLARLEKISHSDGSMGTSSMMGCSVSSRANRTAPAASSDLPNTSVNHPYSGATPAETRVLGERNHSYLPPPTPSPISREKDSKTGNRGRNNAASVPPSNDCQKRSRSAGGELKSPAPREQKVAMGPPSVLHTSMSGLTGSEQLNLLINSRSYKILRLLAKGGSAKVYTAMDLTTLELWAVKVVELGDDEQMKAAYLNEIRVLESLQGHAHVVVLHDYEVIDDTLYVVLEKGETDFNSYLKERIRRKEVNANMVRFFWSELLNCVKVIHDKNIVHSDLKPANFLFVNSRLKLIDFGIASSIPTDQTSALKDTLMGTLSFMPPEQIQPDVLDGTCSKYKLPLKSDVWSLGCILYYMVYGYLPFNNFNSQQMKAAAIVNPNYEIPFANCEDDDLLDTMKQCLVRDVTRRADVDTLLAHPYLSGRPSQKSSPSLDSPLPTDMVRLANELKENTPNTMARKLHKLILRSKSRDARDDVRTTLDFEEV